MLAIIFVCLLRSANSQYSSMTESTIDAVSEASYGRGKSDVDYTRLSVPVAPPRVLIRDTPSFGYRPPPPPIRRNAKSSGKCSFGMFASIRLK